MSTVQEFSKQIKKYYLPYLPYKRLFVSMSGKVQDTDFNLSSGLTAYKNKSSFGSNQHHSISEHKIFKKEFKIVLRPLLELSDLVETEFINYRMGMQYNEEIVNLFCLEFTHSEEKLVDIDLTTLPYQCAEYFFKYGYDFFGLIEKGLAVDINTLSVE